MLAVASGSAAVALAVALIPSAAEAVTWDNGTKVSHDYHMSSWPNTDTVGNKAVGCGHVSYVEVKKDGDYTFVKDQCADGRSATAQVIVYNKDQSIRSRKYCRNSHGAGTWARCNFDWVESDSGFCMPTDPSSGTGTGFECGNKVLIAGTYDGDTGDTWWDHGTSIMFED
jgi:hypothetical protein